MEELHLHDLVALTAALPEYNLHWGEIGVVVDISLENQYVGKFVGKTGIPYAMSTSRMDDLIKVYLQADLA